MKLRIFDRASAEGSILQRKPLGEGPVSDRLRERIREVFGADFQPQQAVQQILADVRSRGDLALAEWTFRLDSKRIERFRIPSEEIQASLNGVSPQVVDSLRASAARVEAFHKLQPINSWFTAQTGSRLGQIFRPIRRVGLYIPGGTAPLPSSVIMSAIPARVAGVEQIALFSPPGPGGKIPNVILAAAEVCGVDEVYSLGGAQAIAAMAYGTSQVPAVDKIFGPGNLFVTLAKREVFGTVGIDGLAGPTETVVIADDSARPDWVALDLLAQAEHDPLAAAILITPSRSLAEKVAAEVEKLLAPESRQPFGRLEIILASLQSGSGIVVTQSMEEAFYLANSFAPEHLSLSIVDPESWLDKVRCAGGVFLGERSFEVLGDYAAGPSHVMPTGGTARFASPLNVLDFMHIISVVGLDPAEAREIALVSAQLARVEGLDAHARSAEARAARDK